VDIDSADNIYFRPGSQGLVRVDVGSRKAKDRSYRHLYALIAVLAVLKSKSAVKTNAMVSVQCLLHTQTAMQHVHLSRRLSLDSANLTECQEPTALPLL